jgi:HAD superfamily hydrolase (TIGR01509 family)
MTETRPLAVLWDMDGTLIDSEPYWLLSEKNLADSHGKQWSEQDGLDLIGQSLYDSSRTIQEKLGSNLSPEEIMHQLTDAVVAQLNQEISWRPGAIELLTELRAHGVKTALVTMSLGRMARAVANQIPFHAFDVVVAGDDVSKGKPDPEPYLKAAELLGVAPEACVAIEDSPTGLRSAIAAGTKAIGVTNFVALPEGEDRTIWSSLEGKKLTDLAALFDEDKF